MPDPIDTAAGELRLVPDPRFRLQWPITAAFRKKIGNEESRGSGGYLARNGDALGAYQLKPIALQDIGWRDKNGNWTEKSGVANDNDFLFGPLKQEIPLKEFLLHNRQLLGANDFDVPVGQVVQGINGDFTITENGLAAAMHREGARMVKRYLKFLAEQGWISDETKFPPDWAGKFKPIETRLRKFADVPYLRPHGH